MSHRRSSALAVVCLVGAIFCAVLGTEIASARIDSAHEEVSAELPAGAATVSVTVPAPDEGPALSTTDGRSSSSNLPATNSTTRPCEDGDGSRIHLGLMLNTSVDLHCNR